MQPMPSQNQRLFHLLNRTMPVGNQRWRCILRPLFCTGLLVCLTLGANRLFAEDEKPKDAYRAAWDDVSELLRRREYGSASAKLEAMAKDQDLRNYGPQLEADRKAIHELQVLEQTVLQQAAQLTPGSPIEISGIEYVFVRYEKSTRGDALILKSKSLGRETKKPIVDLPSGTWVELAELDPASLECPELTFGIFLTLDRIADRKAARKLLNEAAATGEDVTVWLTRLEAGEKTAPDQTSKSDPIVGSWSGRFGPYDHAIAATYDFRSNGAGVMKIDPKLLAAWKAPPGNGPKEWEVRKALVRGVNTFNWQRKDDDTYKLTFKTGGQTFDGLVLDGDTLTLPGYHSFVRPAKK